MDRAGTQTHIRHDDVDVSGQVDIVHVSRPAIASHVVILAVFCQRNTVIASMPVTPPHHQTLFITKICLSVTVLACVVSLVFVGRDAGAAVSGGVVLSGPAPRQRAEAPNDPV